MDQVLFSHKSDHWRTPSFLYQYYMNHGYIDPCPYLSDEDNLNKIYSGEKLFVNPPFSKLNEWADFVIRNYKKNTIIFLMPSRTDTIYFHKLLELNPQVVFIKGRLSFNDMGVSPFPTLLLIFNYPFNFMPCYSVFDFKKMKEYLK